MTWLYGLLGLVLGVALGWAMHAVLTRRLEAELREIHAGLRFVRNTIGIAPGYRALGRYIDRLLGDEAA